VSPRAGLIPALVGFLVVACGAPGPSATVVPPSPIADLPEPGRPYAADDILDAMRDSRRPDGVAEELQTAAVAAAVADAIWTYGGEPWDAIVAGGSCGATACTLEVAGGRGGVGGDTWVFSVDPASGGVELVDAELQAIPAELVTELDRAARLADDDGLLDGLLLTAARWIPPPADQVFGLAYRSGDEEQSCSVDLEIDAVRNVITEVISSGC
jgi:hypothetical protein